MSTQPSAQTELERAIHKAVEGEVDKIKEAGIKQAVEIFETNLRQAIGRVAISLANYYYVERTGSELVIRVQIQEKK
jgi:hypothetical protein